MGHGRRSGALRASAAIVWALCVAACGDDDGAAGGDAGRRDAAGGADAAGIDGSTDRDGGGGRDGGGSGSDGGGMPSIDCPALPASGGTEVRVGPSQADELVGLVRDAAPNTTFLLADGTYTFSGGDEASRRIQVRAAGVTIRSESNDASAVILDGEHTTNEILTIHADDVTIAHITITRAVDHPIHVTPGDDGDVNGTLLYGLRVVDGGEQFVKINSNGAGAWADDGRIECSLFQMTDSGRANVETLGGSSCYTGGVDAHSARGWVVRNNRFEDIYCDTGRLAEHAVHFWSASRDTVVENNTIIDCARGIGFGLVADGMSRPYADDPYPGVGYIGHYDGIIRNNVIFADHAYYDTGIELAQARGARVHHNTVWSTAAATGFFSSIDYRFANTQVEVRNNITRRITMRDGASGTVASNIEDAGEELFVDAGALDFHLAPSATSAIDQGEVVAEAGVDMDGEAHDAGAAPDIGADEVW